MREGYRGESIEKNARINKRLEELHSAMKNYWYMFEEPVVIDNIYQKLNFYVIKRLRTLVQFPNDYNFKGGSSIMTYKDQLWSPDLPCDADLVALVFCRLLDESYYSEYQKKQRYMHYVRFVDSYRVSSFHED